MSHPPDKKEALTWEDLRQHGLGLLRGIRTLLRFFSSLAFGNYRLTTGLVTLLTVTALLFMLYQRAQTYEASTTLVYADLHPKIFGDMIDKVDALISFQQTERAAAMLHLDPSQVEKIKSVRITDTRGRSLLQNYTMAKEPLILSIKLTGMLSEDSLERAMIGYLNNNPFTAERIDLKKQLWREELRYNNEKIATIDSVLSTLYSPQNREDKPSARVTIENSEGKSAYDLLSFSRELLQRKSAIENQLAQPENVFPIDNLLILPQAKFDPVSILKQVIFGCVIGLLLTSLIVLWRKIILPGL